MKKTSLSLTPHKPFLASIGLMSVTLALIAFFVVPNFALGHGAWTLVSTPIIDSSSTSYDTSTNGVGSPSVEWDPDTNQFIMVFEYRTPSTDSRCPAGVWGLGMARSSDNVTWTVDTNPLYVPTPGDGTYYSCVTAHPSVMWSENTIDGTTGDDLRVYFKAQQGTDACASGTPAWGCNAYTGVGDMLVDLDSSGLVESTDIATTPDLMIDGEFGYGNVVQRSTDGKYIMLVQQKALETSSRWDIYEAASFTERGGWADVYKVMQPDTTRTWAKNEFYTPAMMCMTNGSLQAFVGGHTITSGNVTSAGWAIATAPASGYVWTVPTTTQFSWSNANEWKHLDGLRIDNDEYMVWFAEKNTTTNKIQIRTGSTTNNVFTGSNIVDRRCAS